MSLFRVSSWCIHYCKVCLTRRWNAWYMWCVLWLTDNNRKKKRQDSGNVSSDSQPDVGDKTVKKLPWSKRQKQQEKLRHHGEYTLQLHSRIHITAGCMWVRVCMSRPAGPRARLCSEAYGPGQAGLLAELNPKFAYKTTKLWGSCVYYKCIISASAWTVSSVLHMTTCLLWSVHDDVFFWLKHNVLCSCIHKNYRLLSTKK